MDYRATIVHEPRPRSGNINDQLQWIAISLGLFSKRDKERSNFRLFILLLKAAKNRESLTSDELAAQLKLSRGTVNHHLLKLLQSGIVVHKGRGYALRAESLRYLIEEIEKDIKRTTEDMKTIAKEIDTWLHL
ncbi:ArsR family transcriptional regulator [Candidatus Woesearchaeota archaeon]|nr:ArsR family transcriptional regulator [Candidatus Woesearchaeota archaeon]